MNRLQRWQCGGIMHDMLMKLKKGSWCVPLTKASIFKFTLRSRSLSSLACIASGCSAALLLWARWGSVASLHGLPIAAGCSAALRTRRLSNLACLTSVCSDLLRSWSLWRRRCSLEVTLSSRSRRSSSV